MFHLNQRIICFSFLHFVIPRVFIQVTERLKHVRACRRIDSHSEIHCSINGVINLVLMLQCQPGSSIASVGLVEMHVYELCFVFIITGMDAFKARLSFTQSYDIKDRQSKTQTNKQTSKPTGSERKRENI